MATTRYREKRRSRKAAGTGGMQRIASAPPRQSGFPGLVPVGTVGELLPALPAANLSVRIAGRYEVRVGRGFDAPTLAQLIRTLEQMA